MLKAIGQTLAKGETLSRLHPAEDFLDQQAVNVNGDNENDHSTRQTFVHVEKV